MKTEPNDTAFAYGTDNYDHKGLTKREHFAGLAMQQFLSGARLPENYDAADEFRMCSERAYEMADAMLKQRSLTNV